MAVTDAIEVVVADDHPPTRGVVRDSLERAGFHICAEASDADEAVAAVAATNPQLALLDIRMPGNGIIAAGLIAADHPSTAIVMLTVSEDDDDLFAALRAGAAGYLLKGMDPAQLPVALRSVLAGEAALPGTLVARLVGEFRVRERRRFLVGNSHRTERLTNREWEVLELMDQGLGTAEIAERLYIARVTVRTHVAAIIRKLHVADRDAAIQQLRRGSR
jgi:two-component system, NarL family, nitrate/nitrite response regulator NarL